MKKLIVILLMLVAVVGYSQNFTEYTATITPDTLTKVETEYFATGEITTPAKTVAIQTLCTQLGGTSDGSAILQVSLDGTSYQTLTETANFAHFLTNDTLTITNGVIWQIALKEAPWKYYRVAATGTANDTTLVTVKYTVKY